MSQNKHICYIKENNPNDDQFIDYIEQQGKTDLLAKEICNYHKATGWIPIKLIWQWLELPEENLGDFTKHVRETSPETIMTLHKHGLN